MLHKLTYWEQNGYHDSDFFISVWDDEAREVRKIEVGSTRYAGGFCDGAYAPINSAEALSEAIDWLTNHIFVAITEAEKRDVLEPKPEQLSKGVYLRLTRNVKHKGLVIPAGTRGEVFWSGAYGHFYAKGYNKPNRENTRVGLRLDDGSMVFVALNACRLHREEATESELRIRSRELAQYCGFSRAVCARHAWDSRNYAADLKERIQRGEVAL